MTSSARATRKTIKLASHATSARHLPSSGYVRHAVCTRSDESCGQPRALCAVASWMPLKGLRLKACFVVAAKITIRVSKYYLKYITRHNIEQLTYLLTYLNYQRIVI